MKAPLKKRKWTPKKKTQKLGKFHRLQVPMGKMEGPKKTIDWQFFSVPSPNYYTPDAWTTGPPSQFTALPIINASTGTNTSVQCLNDTKQGSATSQRLGLAISMKSIRLRFGLTISSVSPKIQSYGLQYRVILLYDKQPNGSYKTLGQIYGQASYTGGLETVNTIGYPFCNLLPSDMRTFVTLYDEVFNEPNYDLLTSGSGYNVTGDTSSRTLFPVDKYIDLRGLETYYGNAGSSTPAIGDIQTGTLCLYVIGQNGYAASNWCLEGSVRLRFYDK